MKSPGQMLNTTMKFSEVLDALKDGKAITNARLAYESAFVVRQIPQGVDKEVIPKMTSLPEETKRFVSERGAIRFHDQVLLFESSPMEGRYLVTSYIPTWEDIFSETWVICD